MLEDLFEAAKAARLTAHAPYSKFKVGAAIRGRSGTIYAGSNVENAAYPNGVCAETSAISLMVASGETAIAEILVLGWSDSTPAAPGLTTPCGGCRQRIREFARASTPVHVAGPEGLRRSFTLDALLPESFGPENLS